MIICICGSRRFAAAMREWEGKLAAAGHVVLSEAGRAASAFDARTLHLVHLRKIQIADAVFVVDMPVNNAPYFGEDTADCLRWAQMHGKEIHWFSAGAGARLLNAPGAVSAWSTARGFGVVSRPTPDSVAGDNLAEAVMAGVEGGQDAGAPAPVELLRPDAVKTAIKSYVAELREMPAMPSTPVLPGAPVSVPGEGSTEAADAA